ncbi:unnamed protein product, partial [Prorocentrum cordatum]
ERGIGKGGRRRRAERRAAPLPQTGQDAGAAGRRGGDGGRGPAGGPGGLHGMGLGEGPPRHVGGGNPRWSTRLRHPRPLRAVKKLRREVFRKFRPPGALTRPRDRQKTT